MFPEGTKPVGYRLDQSPSPLASKRLAGDHSFGLMNNFKSAFCTAIGSSPSFAFWQISRWEKNYNCSTLGQFIRLDSGNSSKTFSSARGHACPSIYVTWCSNNQISLSSSRVFKKRQEVRTGHISDSR